MKEFLKKYIKKLWWIALIIAIIAIIVEFEIIELFYSWLGLGVSADGEPKKLAVIIYRNRGFALAAILGLFFTLIGFGFTAWGRRQTNKQIALSRKANASERYEKAAHMLGNTVLAVRIAGCHALENLGKDDKKMKPQCIQLLSTFIVNPFDDKNETDKKKTKSLFIGIKLSQDVQAAVNGLSAIYRYYYEKSGETVLDKADLTGADLRGVDLKNAYLKGVDLTGAKLRGADLRGADLRGADLRGADLFGYDLRDANLTEADLRNANLTKANLTSAHLTHADLRDANLTEADLTRADLTEAILSEADLTGAKLKGAKLKGAFLRYSFLMSANLRLANLVGADLTGADLSSANNLTESQILSTKFFLKAPDLPEEWLQYEVIQKWIEDNMNPE